MLSEAKKKTRTIPVNRAYVAQQAALMRLQLYLTGATHLLLRNCYEAVSKALLTAGGKDGVVDGMGLFTVNQAIEREWQSTLTAWKKLFESLRREAASIPFGAMAVLHNALVVPTLEERRRQPGRTLEEGKRVFDSVFTPQLQAILDAADRRLYKDNLNWSQRVWKLDTESRAGMKRVLMNGVANGTAAWDIAKELEQYLGAGQGCPRWTRERLFGLTKKDIASGDRTGLFTGDDCQGQGVAYKALRLARNEIQIAHHIATDTLMARQPWIEQEKIELSPDHPVKDICDDVTGGGEDGDGVYPVGEISLPLHVGCICFKTAVLMDPDMFIENLRGWMTGEQPWAAMDNYAAMIGGSEVLSDTMTGVVVGALVSWLWDDLDDILSRID